MGFSCVFKLHTTDVKAGSKNKPSNLKYPSFGSSKGKIKPLLNLLSLPTYFFPFQNKKATFNNSDSLFSAVTHPPPHTHYAS